jgi:hypothetical protein
MRMPSHTLKLLALLAAITVAPATAGNRSSCPQERARLAALAPIVPVVQPTARPKVPTRITLIDRVPADSILGMGRSPSFVSP